MEADELEDLYAAVLSKLKIRVGVNQMVTWGYLTIKEWVYNHAEQGEVDPNKIATLILEDWENESI